MVEHVGQMRAMDHIARMRALSARRSKARGSTACEHGDPTVDDVPEKFLSHPIGMMGTTTAQPTLPYSRGHS